VRVTNKAKTYLVLDIIYIPVLCWMWMVQRNISQHTWETYLYLHSQQCSDNLSYNIFLKLPVQQIPETLCTDTATVQHADLCCDTHNKWNKYMRNDNNWKSYITYVSWRTNCDTLSVVRETETRITGPFIRKTNLEFLAWMDRIVSWFVCTKDTNACITPNMVTSLSSLPYLWKEWGQQDSAFTGW
jgi:hypothetical protein